MGDKENNSSNAALRAYVDLVSQRVADQADEIRTIKHKQEKFDEEIGGLSEDRTMFVRKSHFDKAIQTLEKNVDRKIETLMQNQKTILIWIGSINGAVLLTVGLVAFAKSLKTF